MREGPAQALSLQHITNVLWTFANFKYLPEEFMKTFVANVETRLHTDKFNVQQLSNLLWALSISQVSSVEGPIAAHSCAAMKERCKTAKE